MSGYEVSLPGIGASYVKMMLPEGTKIKPSFGFSISAKGVSAFKVFTIWKHIWRDDV